MIERALSFGAAASSYERFRPGYPAEVVDRILDYAARPVRTALEIGAGTGKATRVVAGRGIAVTASDPDPAMLDELRRHVPSSVTTVLAAFEDLPIGRRYDLVFAAASLHWTRAAGRWERVSALLGPGGVFASFGGQAQLVDSDLAEAVRAARAGLLRTDDVPSTAGRRAGSATSWPAAELLDAAGFVDVQQSTVPRRIRVTAAEYIGHLSTVSAYLVLPDGERQEVFARILAVLPDDVELSADIVLHLARAV